MSRKYYNGNEKNESEFKRTHVWFHGAETLELEVSLDGASARYRRTLKTTIRAIVTKGRWQDVKYDANGYAYILMYKRQLFIHHFQRVL